MNRIYNLKILIVGLTTVLALASFNESDFRKDMTQNTSFSKKI